MYQTNTNQPNPIKQYARNAITTAAVIIGLTGCVSTQQYQPAYFDARINISDTEGATQEEVYECITPLD